MQVSEINFHDALLIDLEYSHSKHQVIILVNSFLVKGQKAVPLRIVFHVVSFFLCSDLSPWGESSHINAITFYKQFSYAGLTFQQDVEGVHIETQSGDSIYIGYKKIFVEQR